MCTNCGCGGRGKVSSHSHDHDHDHHHDHHHHEKHHHDHHHGDHHHGDHGHHHENHTVELLNNILSENDRIAAHNREHFDEYGTFVVNLMSSPGAGKTRLLEETIRTLGTRYKIAVIEGDLETENDAERIRACNVPCLQITTGSACHLDAEMIHRALHDLPLQGLDILFIENVGNLVCPASFALGQHADVVLLSVPEGDDKPAKYPVMFRTADLVLLTKTDLLPVMDEFSTDRARACLHNLANPAPVFEISAKKQETLTPWLNWLEEHTKQHKISVG